MHLFVKSVVLGGLLLVTCGGTCDYNRDGRCEISERRDFDVVGNSCLEITVADTQLARLDGIQSVGSGTDLMDLHVLRNQGLTNVDAIAAGRYERMDFIDNPLLEQAEFFQTGASIRFRDSPGLKRVMVEMGGASERRFLNPPTFSFHDTGLREFELRCENADCMIQRLTFSGRRPTADPATDALDVRLDARVHASTLKLDREPLSSLELFYDLQVSRSVQLVDMGSLDSEEEEEAIATYLAALDANGSPAEVTWCQSSDECTILRERIE